MMQMAEELSEFLVANFPNADQNFVSIANNYTKQLRDLDTEVEEVLSAIPADRRVMVTNHSVFAYFAERYEFEILGEIIPTTSTLANASAQQLAALAEELKSSQVSAIFADASSSNILAQTIASEVDGVEVVNLFTESLGDPDAAGASYIEMVRFNAQTIASALLD
jgi:zinc/manganese transport system substrate-binding protein